MEPNFKEKFVKIRTCGFREQCTRPHKKTRIRKSVVFSAIQTYT